MVVSVSASEAVASRLELPDWLVDSVDLTNSTLFEVSFAGSRSLYLAIQKYGAKHFESSRFDLTSVPIKGAYRAKLQRTCISLPVELSEEMKVEGDLEKTAVADELDAVEKFSKFETNLGLGLGLHKTSFKGKEILVFNAISRDWTDQGLLPKFIALIIQDREPETGALLSEFCDFILAEVHRKGISPDSFTIFGWDIDERYWQVGGTKVKRPIDSIFLPKDLKRKILKDLSAFLSVQGLEFHSKHGIPYKRSYMLFGAPGCGKTSLIQSIAGVIERDLYVIQVSNPRMTDDELKTAMSSLPTKSVVVFEDIDALFDETRAAKTKSSLTFSGLLNSLDGVGDPAGSIFFLTTNYPERLDKALIRHGRVDLMLEFPSATPEQVKDMFLSYYEKEDALAAEFSEKIFAKFGKDAKISMAAIQQHFIIHMFAKPATVVKAVDEMEGDH